jgi:hypothetical protein
MIIAAVCAIKPVIVIVVAAIPTCVFLNARYAI